MALWTAKDVSEATGGTLHGGDAWVANGFAMDSRKIQPGDIFLALPGEKVDGHIFLDAAQKAGAAAAIVSRLPETPMDLPLLVVPEADGYEDLPDRSAVLIALWKLAIVARKRAKAKIIAVTGSVGKTSAKEALALALSAYGSVHATRGNFNNHIGLPLTLAALPADADFAVLEMGMNHANEILPLSQLARPDVALITTVDAVHIEYFDGIEGIAKAKAEVFAGLGASGTAVLPADNAQLEILRAEAAKYGVQKLRYFGKVECAEFAVSDVVLAPEGTGFSLTYQGKVTRMHVRAVGAHWTVVMSGVMAVIESLKLDWAKAMTALAAFQEPVGRGRLQEVMVAGKRIGLLDDSYNASPVSMRAAIEKLGLLAQKSNRRPVAVLGQMLELGTTAESAHRAMAEALQTAHVPLVGACGAHMRTMINILANDTLPIDEPSAPLHGTRNETLLFASDAASLRDRMEAELNDGDLVLIKGSHGSKVYQIAEAWLKHAS